MNASVRGLLVGHSRRASESALRAVVGAMEGYLPVDPFFKQPQVEEQLLAELRASCGQGADERWGRLKEWLCLPPQYTTVRVNTRRTSAEDARVVVQEHLDRSHVRLGEAPLVLRHPCLNELLLVLSHQCGVRVAPSSREVVVDADCGQAVLRGAHVFVPGVLGAPRGLEVGQQVAVFADLEGSCLRGFTRPYRGRRAFLGNGTALVSRRDIFISQLARGVAVQMTEPLYGCPPVNGLMTGSLLLQNLPSVVCGRVLGPQPGECVLDMCAAPGGKTTHLATLMDDKGMLVALDRAENRLARVRALCDLWGLSCVRAYAHDANDYDALVASVQEPRLPECFDRVLLDAPCSGLGQRPLLVCRQLASQLHHYPPQQKALLETAVRLLKPGGILVYSTCTLTTAENEAIVAWALERFPELRLAPQVGAQVALLGDLRRFCPAIKLAQRLACLCMPEGKGPMPPPFQEPHLGAVGRAGAGLDNVQRCLVQRFEGQPAGPDCPDYDVDTIGFFIARFRKAS